MEQVVAFYYVHHLLAVLRPLAALLADTALALLGVGVLWEGN